MLSKVETGLWFARRPRFWPHAATLVARKFQSDLDAPGLRADATRWAEGQAQPLAGALVALGLITSELEAAVPTLPEALLEEARTRAAASQVRMGGPGALGLLYAATLLTGARVAVETGVAYGWSSFAILAGLAQTGGRLVSVDMPYPKANNEPFVGIAVPDAFRSRWELIREPDRFGLVRALRSAGGTIDLAHYDSDKSYRGRMWAYPRLWAALRPGGLFISDDIQDNFGFRDFAQQLGRPFAVLAENNKYVGLIRK